MTTTETRNRVQFMEAVRQNFAAKTADGVTKTDVEALDALLTQAASGVRGYITYWDIEVSGAENFFHQADACLKEWSNSSAFADRNVLKTVTQRVLAYYLKKERERTFPCENLGTGRITYRTLAHHISWCETTAANLLRDLGFYGDALALYQTAVQTAGSYYESARDQAYGEQRKLVAAYRRSGQTITELNELDARLQRHIVESARRQAVHNVYNLTKWTDACYWDTPLKAAHQFLKEMSYADEKTRDLILRPAYEVSAEALIHDRDNVVKDQAKYGRTPEQCSWRSESLIEMYERLGNQDKVKEWRRVYLRAKQLELIEWIARFTDRVGEKKEGDLKQRRKAPEKILENLAEVTLELAQLDGYNFSKS